MQQLVRPDIATLSAYKAESLADITATEIDKIDANEVSSDLPDWFKSQLGTIASDQIKANRYPDGEYAHLKQLIANYVGHGITSSQISIGCGSDEIIRSLLVVACLHRGSIMVAEPTFSMYDILARSLGIPVVKVPRHDQNFQIDLAAAQAAIEQHHVAAIGLVHPNSPTGNLLNSAELDWVRSLPSNILVVIDEAYFEFASHTLAAELDQHPNWLIMRTFSKAFRLAAYRVGYAFAANELIEALEKVRLPYNLPTIAHTAAELAMDNRDRLLELVPEIRQERDRLYRELSNLGLRVWPSAGNFLYARGQDNKAIAQALKQKGTLIRQTGGGLRITVGTRSQNQRLIERMGDCLNSL
ncbi:Histidinol-phosphate aminotransferase [Thalassoporum mexicanum PCC 7367]|uniref:histidinol-phosphate transaminase n=1 Tax=Thalassoporum mexicanum TaxID=3457544 RepID=UPI00029FDE21|nr:histidinol-phosphate transaminase [Pseudanabaena sp. PCC 7367]AFY69620.1 Histidinol-phosphate aminotransferase [Pseudanabaena sp. PCC 7367]